MSSHASGGRPFNGLYDSSFHVIVNITSQTTVGRLKMYLIQHCVTAAFSRLRGLLSPDVRDRLLFLVSEVLRRLMNPHLYFLFHAFIILLSILVSVIRVQW